MVEITLKKYKWRKFLFKMKHIKEESKFLRTLLRADIAERLEIYAKSLQTGMGKWDYGVAIERLLDNLEFVQEVSILQQRIDELEVLLLNSSSLNKEEKQTEDEEQLLGRHAKVEK